MTGVSKRKISAKQIVADIRSGMNQTELKQRYELSDDALRKVISRLAAAELLTADEIRSRSATRAVLTQASHRQAGGSPWRCPSCGVAQANAVEECPECGVVVKKFLARRGLKEHVPIVVARDDEGGSWIGVVASIVVCIVVSTGLVYWSMHRAREKAYAPVKISRSQTVNESRTSGDSQQVEETEDVTPIDSLTSGDTGNAASGGDSSASLSPSETRPSSPSASKEKAPLPQENRSPSSDKYRTGVLRQFSSADFKEEVVEASKTYPVVFQFYSST